MLLSGPLMSPNNGAVIGAVPETWTEERRKQHLKPLEEPSCLDVELADTQEVDLFSNTNEMQNNNL